MMQDLIGQINLKLKARIDMIDNEIKFLENKDSPDDKILKDILKALYNLKAELTDLI